GLSLCGAATASLLLNLEGVFTALLAWFVFRENFDNRVALGMLCIVAGGLLLSWQGGHFQPSSGIPAIVLACLCWAIDNNLTQKVSGQDPTQIAAWKGAVAGVVNLAVAVLARGASLPAWQPCLAAMLVGFLGYGVSLALFVVSLRHIGTARTGAYFSLAPFVGAGLAMVLGSEPLSALFWAAAALMAVGVWLHLTERHEHEHTHEALEHCHFHYHDEHHQHHHDFPHDARLPHSHWHVHEPITHTHAHYPDIHHRHEH
ncbi:MAG: DMT family transporter, partial [Candidatus Eremiobacteraeota bacterium]|nr:DMT family transporter [Candidatus Eremiobacteraeota bacterium]